MTISHTNNHQPHVTLAKEEAQPVPVNGVTRKKYFGKLAEDLYQLSLDCGYSSHEWATLPKWNSIGETIAKGEKGYRLVRTVKGQDPADPNGEPPESFFLFNRCQLQSAKAS